MTVVEEKGLKSTKTDASFYSGQLNDRTSLI